VFTNERRRHNRRNGPGGIRRRSAVKAGLSAGLVAVVAVVTGIGATGVRTAQAAVGIVDEKPPYTVFQQPPPPALPGPGGVFTDPTFGTRIMRITAGGGFHAYSYWPSFNVDSTKLYVPWLGQPAYVYDFDPVNFRLGARESMFQGGSCAHEDASWSGVDPNLMLCHDLNGAIKSYNVVTKQWTVITQLDVPHTWQMTRSIDDQVFAMTTKDQDYHDTGWLVYDRRTGQVTRQATTDINEVHIDKTGRYLFHVTNTAGPAAIESVVVDLQTGTRTDLTDDAPDYTPNHYDLGTGTVIGNDNWLGRITKRSLATPHQFQTLMTWPDWSQASHLSMLADNEDWVLVSAYLANTGVTRSGQLDGEIFQVATDGSGRVRHLVHHHTDVPNTPYERTPRANISRDGRFVTFTSSWGTTTPDVFVAEVADAPTPTPTTSCR
jgi:hypothetical protein